MSRWEVAFWMCLFALFALLPWAMESKSVTPPTLVDQWANVYRTCVGSYPNEQLRVTCIATADRVVACVGQKEGKHE